jgi:hypothetical protein
LLAGASALSLLAVAKLEIWYSCLGLEVFFMIYVKSIMSGIAASAVAVCAVYMAGLVIAFLLVHKYSASEPDTYFVRWHVHFWPVLGLALAVFALGFYWELKRASR